MPVINKPNQYFDAVTYTGNGTEPRAITGVSFQPDFVWYKGRSTTFNHGLFDSIRGTLQRLSSNLTSAELTTAGSLTAFNSNGFSVGSDAGANQNTDTYVAWQWKAGGAAVTNTSGSISSQVSANPTAGFSIATFTAQTSGTGTVGHGLGVAPAFIITKNRSGTVGWNVYHKSLGGTRYIILNSTGAEQTSSVIWNNTNPTSTVFSFGSGFANSGTYVAYCWSEIEGFSKFGSYTGNGSADGPFVYLGFRPKFVLMKATTGSNNWIIYDTVRNTYNLTNLSLVPDSSAAENGVSVTTENTLDILSNGFKLRTSNALTNGSSVPYIYMAFAENPFKYANAR